MSGVSLYQSDSPFPWQRTVPSVSRKEIRQLSGADCFRNWIDWQNRLETQNRNTAAARRNFLDKGELLCDFEPRSKPRIYGLGKDTSMSSRGAGSTASYGLISQTVKKGETPPSRRILVDRVLCVVPFACDHLVLNVLALLVFHLERPAVWSDHLHFKLAIGSVKFRIGRRIRKRGLVPDVARNVVEHPRIPPLKPREVGTPAGHRGEGAQL